MKMLKAILIIIVALIAIVLIVALFVKKEYVIEKEITIHKPQADVFNYIRLLKNQDHYSKWVMLDPDMKKDFTGTDGMVGFIYAWDSENKNAGKGEQEIKQLNGEEIVTEVRFKKPMENTAEVYMIAAPAAPNQTTVKWGMRGKNSYPLNIMNLFIPDMLGKDLQTSLTNLKSILEK